MPQPDMNRQGSARRRQRRTTGIKVPSLVNEALTRPQGAKSSLLYMYRDVVDHDM